MVDLLYMFVMTFVLANAAFKDSISIDLYAYGFEQSHTAGVMGGYIKVDGVDRKVPNSFGNYRGHKVVVISEITGEVLDSVAYDTYLGTVPSQDPALSTYLNTIPSNDRIVAIVTADEASGAPLSNNILQSWGCPDATIDFRESFIFLGTPSTTIASWQTCQIHPVNGQAIYLSQTVDLTMPHPTTEPSLLPSANPTDFPSSNPSSVPSANPTGLPSSNPSVNPSQLPSNPPSAPTSIIHAHQPTNRPTPAVTEPKTLETVDDTTAPPQSDEEDDDLNSNINIATGPDPLMAPALAICAVFLLLLGCCLYLLKKYKEMNEINTHIAAPMAEENMNHNDYGAKSQDIQKQQNIAMQAMNVRAQKLNPIVPMQGAMYHANPVNPPVQMMANPYVNKQHVEMQSGSGVQDNFTMRGVCRDCGVMKLCTVYQNAFYCNECYQLYE
eukprot:56621_1